MRKAKRSDHAEIEAIDDACKNLGSWRLDGCHMFVTLEPAPCARSQHPQGLKGFISERLTRLGAAGSAINILEMKGAKVVDAFGGIMEAECAALLKEFLTRQEAKIKAPYRGFLLFH